MRKLCHQILQLYWKREGNGRLLEGSEPPGRFSAGAQSCPTQVNVSANGQEKKTRSASVAYPKFGRIGVGEGTVLNAVRASVGLRERLKVLE